MLAEMLAITEGKEIRKAALEYVDTLDVLHGATHMGWLAFWRRVGINIGSAQVDRQ